MQDSIRWQPHEEKAGHLEEESALQHYELGRRLSRDGQQADALHHLQRALEIAPNFTAPRVALARLLAQRQRIEDAIAELRIAHSLAPADLDAGVEFGSLLANADRYQEAEAVLRRVIQDSPEAASARVNLGVVLFKTGRVTEAETELRHALELDCGHGVAAYFLSLSLSAQRKVDQAESVAYRAVELNSTFGGAYVELGNVLLATNSGDITRALDCFRKSIEIDGGCLQGFTNLAYMRMFQTDDGHVLLDETRRAAARVKADVRASPAPYDNDRTNSRRLRIGYVSPDFRYHCQAMFLTPLLSHHDEAFVEVYCYSSVTDPDDYTRQLASFADVWRDVHRLSDEQVAQQVRDDRIDILVDLTMYMSNGRPLLFAMRPAPVQIAWLAYPGTTGSDAIGYRLTDPRLDPLDQPNADARYSERSIRLADTFWCYDPLISDIDVGPLPADSNGFITFACLNNPSKLTDRAFALWAHVLENVERSRMLVMAPEGRHRQTILDKFAKLGIDPARMRFIGYQPKELYLRTYNDVDIVLDTFPYNGHTTSLDALYMGVPVTTMIGRGPVSRAGYSLLWNLGLEELAAASEEEFVACAMALARDLPRLRELRASLRERMKQSPLMDAPRFARAMETAFRHAWSEWCETF